ncbi:MAG: excinuclease ABC subunit UvrC, partial [Alphaproteobacteria bacterium]
MTEQTAEERKTGRKRRKGVDIIAAVVRTLPGAPGVYRMLDARGDALYVGKARDLKKRVASYTKLTGHNTRIARMISLTASMEVVTTASETEALLLEASLIKRLRPRYNVHLRDDKSFPYIMIARDHEAPRIRKHRGARSQKGDYFGPFASAGAVNRTLNTLQKAFLLRSCTDSVYENRTRPCLLYQIKRCAAPCTGEISLADYTALVDEAAAFLRGENTQTHEHLARQMEEAAQALDFERAAALRDRIRALSAIRAHHGVDAGRAGDADVVAAATRGGQTCVQVFFYRSGQNWGTRAFFPRHDKSDSEADVLDAFLAQFYGDKPPPPRILLNRDVPGRELLEQALTLKADRKVSVHVPQRGEKRTLVEMAARNAREALGRRLAESASQRKLLEDVADTFDLEGPPRRIEVYDNSHIQGANPVGAMIVAGPDGFQKSHYRKFNIRNTELARGDDYGMMREVLTRRFSRLVKES